MLHGLILRRFFKQRIGIEEKTLLSFFNKDYLNYAKNTPQFYPISLSNRLTSLK